MAPHSSTPAWKIPWTEEPGRLQSMGSQRVRHDWATSLSLFTFMHWRRKRQPTPVLLPGESQGRGSLVGCRLWGRTESDTPEATQQQQQRQQRQQWWGATKQIGKTKSGPSMTSHLQSTGSRRLEYTYLPLKISVPLIQQPGNLFMYRMSVISFNGCYSQKSTYKSPRNYIKGSHCWLHSLNLLCKGVFC